MNTIDKKFIKPKGLKKKIQKNTSVNLTLEQYAFLKQNKIDVSKLFRALLDDYMNNTKKGD